jgi:hypothetical protein
MVAQPVFFNTSLPVLQDMYLCIFIWSISAGYQTLGEKVRSTQGWSKDCITEIGKQWISLKKLMIYHNTVSVSNLRTRDKGQMSHKCHISS